MPKLTSKCFFQWVFTLIAVGFSFTSQAQLQILSSNNSNNPDSLVRNVLLGRGVEVVSLTYTGDTAVQFGFFTDPNQNIIGLDSGIIMCTGEVENLLPGNTIPGGGNPAVTPISFADSVDLVTIANDVYNLINLPNPPNVNDLEDIAVINFEFIPQSDTVEFTYVFGSQEYPQYDTNGVPLNNGFINTQFNDVFGFFISGPGITGSYTSPPQYPGGSQNVAFLPGTNPPLPITVSSVHNGGSSSLPTFSPLNNQFFVPGDTSKVSLRGFTRPLKARMVLQACDTYNIRLAITDIEDGSFHSAVFLEARSFGSPNIEISAVPVLYNLNDDGNLYEDCGSVQIGFRRFSQINQQRTVHFTISGSATNGIDYSFLPDSVTFNAGQAVANINLNIITDTLPEGPETLVIGLRPDTLDCAIQDSATLLLRILDPEPLQLSDPTLFVDCITDTIFVKNPIVSGVEPVQYQWDIGVTLDSIKYFPTNDSIFHVTATDACGNFTDTGQVNVVLGNPPLILQTQNDSMVCTDDSIQIGVTVVSGSVSQRFQWSTGQTSQSIFVSPSNDSIFYVTVTDFCDSLNPVVDSVVVFQVSPTLSLSSVDDTLDCEESNTTLSVKVMGGSAQQNFLWSTGATSNTTQVSNVGKDSVYFVSVTDVCNLTDTVVDTIEVFDLDPPLAISTSDITLQCNQSLITIAPTIISGSSQQFYQWSTGDTTQQISVNPIDTTTYQVTVTDACDSSAIQVDSITVFVTIPPLVIQAQDVSVVCDTGKVDVEVLIQSGNPPFSFFWDNGEIAQSFSTTIQGDTAFVVTITDACGATEVDTADFDFSLPVPIQVASTDTTIDCPGDTVVVTPSVSGGSPPYTFIWSTGTSGNTLTTAPLSDTSFVLQIQDLCPLNLKFDTVNIALRDFPPLESLLKDTLIDCLGDSIQLIARDTGGLPPYLSRWEYSGGSTIFIDSSFLTIRSVPDSVFYFLEDQCGNTFNDTLFVGQTNPPAVNVSIPNDTLICNDEELILEAKVQGGVPPYRFYWEIDGIEQALKEQVIQTQLNGTSVFYVSASDRCGEKDDSEGIFLAKPCTLTTPNVFTPNGDGKNDFFVIEGISIGLGDDNFLPQAGIEIFNRWGQLVYRSERYQNNWDGHPVAEGTYFYVLTLSTGEVIKGSVTLLR